MSDFAKIAGSMRLRLRVFGAGRPGAVPEASATPSPTSMLAENGAWVPVAPASRAINAGTGLTGGGSLAGDRTLSIAGYTGPVCKDWNEASRTYAANSTTTLKKYDVGSSSFLWIHNILVPARNQVGLTCKLVAHMADGSTVDVQTNATDADIGLNAQTSQDRMYGNAGVGQAATNDANGPQAVSFVVVNSTGAGIIADIGTFRLRALAYPRGGGALTVT